MENFQIIFSLLLNSGSKRNNNKKLSLALSLSKFNLINDRTAEAHVIHHVI